MDHQAADFKERRNSQRIDMEAERIMIAWMDKQGALQQEEGICIDLARHGVLIQYQHPFTLGELITITFNPDTDKQNIIKAQVCRCYEYGPQCFHIAMQII